jgi:hypothetical protein
MSFIYIYNIDIHFTSLLLQDFEGDEVTVTFTVNGEMQGLAYTITHSELQDKALFPHVLSKNTKFKCNFGNEDSWFPPPDGYTFVAHVAADERVSGPKRPERREDCEVHVGFCSEIMIFVGGREHKLLAQVLITHVFQFTFADDYDVWSAWKWEDNMG